MKTELKRLPDTLPSAGGRPGKAGHACAPHAPQPSAVVEAAPLELAPGLSVEQGFQAIIGNCLAQVQGNEPGVAKGSDPESVHQMRIGLRRLRSALGLFAKLAPCPAALRQELLWLGSELGAARDSEVFAGDTLAQVIEAHAQAAQWGPLQQAASRLARRNRKKAATAVASARYVRLQLALGAWLQGARWRETLPRRKREALAAPLTAFAKQALAQRQRTLKKRGKRLQGSKPQERHRLRIAAKNVRYAAGFFQSLGPAKWLRRYVADLATLQDALGAFNDASVADGLLQQLAQTCPALAQSASLARSYLLARSDREGRKFGKLCKRLARLRPSRR